TGAAPTEDRAAGLATKCAGVFLLSRAVLDANLAATVQTVRESVDASAIDFSSLLAAIALRWTGADGLRADGHELYLDEGLSLFSGLPRAPTIDELHGSLGNTIEHTGNLLQEAVLARLIALRVLGGSTLHVHRVSVDSAHTALIAGPESADIWPLGAVGEPADYASIVSTSIAPWSSPLSH